MKVLGSAIAALLVANLVALVMEARRDDAANPPAFTPPPTVTTPTHDTTPQQTTSPTRTTGPTSEPTPTTGRTTAPGGNGSGPGPSPSPSRPPYAQPDRNGNLPDLPRTGAGTSGAAQALLLGAAAIGALLFRDARARRPVHCKRASRP